MFTNELIDKIKGHPLYRGELLPYLRVIASRENSEVELDESLEYILDSLDISLFDFQLKSVKCYLDGANIYLSGGYGLGKSTTIDILAIFELFTSGKSLLYLLPTGASIEKRLERTKSNFSKIKEFIPIQIEIASTSLNLKEKLKSYPEVVICTAEIFYELIRNYPQEKIIKDYLFSTGLIGIEKIDHFKPNEIIYLSRLINLLESMSSSRFVISSSSSEDLQSFINLFQKEISLEPIEIREFKKNNDIFIWIPPFDVILLEDKNTFVFKRNDFMAEVKNLLKILDRFDNKKILIWYAYNNLSSKVKLGLSHSANVTITDNLAQISLADQKEFDAAILIGMARDYKNIVHHINSFVRENGNVFIIPPDDLLSYLLMWSDFQLIHKLPGRKLFPFAEADLIERVFNHIKKVLSGRRLDTVHSPYWGMITNDFVEMGYPSGSKRQIDRGLLPTNVYEGHIYFEDEKRYLAKFLENHENFVVDLSTPGEDYATSSPLIEYEISYLNEISREKQSVFGKIKKISCNLSINQEGYILYTDYTQEDRSQIRFDEPYKFKKYLKGVRLKTDFPHEIEHSIYNFLPLLFANALDIIFVFCDSEYVYFFPHQPEFYHFIEKYFYSDFESTIKKNFQFLYEALCKCPCEDGCSKCLYYPFHREIDGLDKEAFGLFIAQTYGKEEVQNYQNLMDFRRGKITSISMLTNFYNGIKERVLNILQNNLDIEIENPVPLGVKTSLESGILGRYDGKLVTVIPLKELQAIQTITHEYIHNWEDEMGVLSRDDKFISEGAAQWLSTKVLNYYYQIDEIEIDILATKVQHLKEYFNGFQFLHEIEQRIGYSDTLDAIVTDSWTEEQLKIRKKWEEYIPSEE